MNMKRFPSSSGSLSLVRSKWFATSHFANVSWRPSSLGRSRAAVLGSLVKDQATARQVRMMASSLRDADNNPSNLKMLIKRANSRTTASNSAFATSKGATASASNDDVAFANGSSHSSSSSPYIHPLPTHISFEDFLQADTNRDGRVTAAEWDNYVRSKQSVEEDPLFRGVTVHIPVSPAVLREIIESDGFGVSINGLHYSLHIKPEGKTLDLIVKAQADLKRLNAEIDEMEARKAPLDAAAGRYTRRVMSGLLGYLLLQAAVVAKLTFFSRFGWDIMEPITYFITFGISLVGLSFFTWNRLEFSYPALAALIARRKAVRLYKKFNFNEEALLALRRDRDKVQRHLDAMVPAHRIFDLENKAAAATTAASKQQKTA